MLQHSPADAVDALAEAALTVLLTYVAPASADPQVVELVASSGVPHCLAGIVAAAGELSLPAGAWAVQRAQG